MICSSLLLADLLLYGTMMVLQGSGRGGLYFNSVEEGNTRVITTARAIEIVVEDPLFPILKQDSNITKPAGQTRGPGLGHDPTSPGFEVFVENLISDLKVDMVLTPRLCF